MIQNVILSENSFDGIVKHATTILENGGIIIYPTDTLYGLGVDATNAKAAKSILQLKGRKEGRGVACVFSTIGEIKKYCQVSDRQEMLLNQYLPGPYTFLLKPKTNTRISNNLIDAERKTIGIRIPNHSFTQKLAQLFQKPYTTTSANISGLPGPKTPQEVEQNFPATKPLHGRDILFIKAGKIPGQPSTVVDLTKTPPEIVRQGIGIWNEKF